MSGAKHAERAATLRRFKPYPAYKDSGVEWLGEIPVDWEVKRLKFVAHIKAGQSPPSEVVRDGSDGLPFLQGNADFGLASPEPRQVCDAAPKHAEAGDILLSVRAPVGAMNIADQQYGIGRGLCAIRLGSMIDRLFGYYALAMTRGQLDSVATGSTYDAVTTSHVGDLPQPLPDGIEQRAIAAFLNRETARIDALVAKKERLIELLQEKRTALITRAVTNGLDATVPMKDSGVEWRGAIPAHWEVKPLKHYLRAPLAYGVLKPDKYSGEDGVRLIRILDVESGLVSEDALELISPGQSNEFRRTVLLAGDLVLSVVGTIGRAFVVPPSLGGANLSRALARMQLKSTLSARFLEYQFGATSFASFVELVPAGTAQRVLNLGDLAEYRLLVPPIREQQAITAFLNENLAKLDALVAKVRDAINRLKELRTALISAAVTGKIDVREEAA